MNNFDVIVVGGSYSGLAASMALGRALRKVLVIDSGKPCNRQTPHSHNFLTQDGNTPSDISGLALKQVQQYDTVKFHRGIATSGLKKDNGFEITTDSDGVFTAPKIIFATGIKDILPPIPGMAESWGISVLHCPYCHGYEVRNATTGILANGEAGFEFSILISNWTKKLTLFTNGASTLTVEQAAKLKRNQINIVETAIDRVNHNNGHIQSIVFNDGVQTPLEALYTRAPFEQSSGIPAALGCELTEVGYIKVDAMLKTTVPGVFAAGDNASGMRSIANAVAMGTMAGAVVNRELVFETAL